MTKIVVIDDEKHGTDVLMSLIRQLRPNYEIFGVFNDSTLALDFIKKNKSEIGLLFTDIQMPKMNGFSLLDNAFPFSFDVIFTTAFDHYAIKAFQYSAINYLLKPINGKDLELVLLNWEQRREKASTDRWSLMKKMMNRADEVVNTIALPTRNGYEIINIESIIRCESENNYTYFYCSTGAKTMISKSLKEVEELLFPYSFFRVHQSHLINAKFVKQINKNDGGSILMNDNAVVPVSRQKKGLLEEILNKNIRFD